MPKFYVISDVHSYYDEMKKALDEAGFDPNDKNNWLISCGDVWDRGPQPVEVMQYLQGLSRKILVRGNHCDLLEDLCKRGYPCSHDFSNGTYDTVCKFGGAGLGRSFEECCIITEQRTKDFIYSMVPYFETQTYIFVHSFIPLKNSDGKPMYYTRNRKFEFDPDWRHVHASEWENARWGNPLELAMKGLNQTGKTIVSGHWHCSAGWAMEAGIPEFGYGACFEPYYYDDKLIMIDAMTAHSKKVNVLVLNDEFLEEGDDTHDSSAAS